MRCERCGLEKAGGAPHDSARSCAVALRQHAQSSLRELESLRKTGTFDPDRIDAFERENRRLRDLIARLEDEASKT